MLATVCNRGAGSERTPVQRGSLFLTCIKVPDRLVTLANHKGSGVFAWSLSGL